PGDKTGGRHQDSCKTDSRSNGQEDKVVCGCWRSGGKGWRIWVYQIWIEGGCFLAIGCGVASQGSGKNQSRKDAHSQASSQRCCATGQNIAGKLHLSMKFFHLP